MVGGRFWVRAGVLGCVLALGCSDAGAGDGDGAAGNGIPLGGGGVGGSGMVGGAAGTGSVGGTAGTGGAGAIGGAAGVGGTGGTAGDAGAGGLGGTGGVGGAGGTGGASGAGGVGGGNGDFPKLSEDVDVALMGPYTVDTYTMTDAQWTTATMYYPTDAPAPFASMAVSPGFTETGDQMSWWGQMLASHGFAVLVTTPNNTFTDQPPDRGVDLEAAVAAIKAENAKAGSPLQGKLALDRIALSGHSMGGGGTLHAAAALGDEVRAAIPLMEHGPAFDATMAMGVRAATLLIAGQNDGEPLGPPTKYSIPHYKQITNAEARGVAVIAGGDHFMGVNGGQHQDVIARYSVAWLKLYLEDDDRYSTYVFGAEHTASAFSDYCTTPAGDTANTAGCQ